MNIALNLSQGQLSKLRNGHGIRISPTMVGMGVDLIIDPMTYHNMMKKLDKGKGAIINMGSAEIEKNKVEGTGLFSGAGNKSGKISRFKKANKWRDFSNDTARMGIDTAKYGYEQYKEATNPIQSQFKKMFGGEMEMDGGKISLKGIKKAYNKNVKDSALGKALRESTGMIVDDVYDLGAKELDKNKYTKPISQYMKDQKAGNVKKITKLSGIGLKLSGEGVMTDRRHRKPVDMDKIMREQMGKGLRMSGGMCCQGCGMMNDHFIFSDVAL